MIPWICLTTSSELPTLGHLGCLDLEEDFKVSDDVLLFDEDTACQRIAYLAEIADGVEWRCAETGDVISGATYWKPLDPFPAV